VSSQYISSWHEKDFYDSLRAAPFCLVYLVALFGLGYFVQWLDNYFLCCVFAFLLFLPGVFVGAFAVLGVAMPIVLGLEWIMKGCRFRDGWW
jgi:hypothetical protein